jgi:hypothetical protein
MVVEAPGVEAAGAGEPLAATTFCVVGAVAWFVGCGELKSARSSPPVRVAMAARGDSPAAETATLVDVGEEVAGKALSASSSIFG